ncbi:hypothetical protein OT109_15035 [Phycisphaeraceae bacterium D3-23]
MPKKRTTKKTPAKTRVELRFDADLYQNVKDTADAAGISVNQLLSGITRWAMDCVHVGSPSPETSSIATLEDPGHLWFGREDWDLAEDNETGIPPEMVLHLDFTEQRAIRERTDWTPDPEEA